MEQRTEEWFAIRCGKVTASKVADVMAKTKTGYSASRKNYMAQLVVERITGEVAESYTNAAMQWGTDTEPFAREAYEIMTGNVVEECAFIEHPNLQAGASPDGLVGDVGMLEIKCPNTATHIDTLLSGKIERKYLLQMQWQMICGERQWCDFVSYDPRMPEGLKYWCKRVGFDNKLAIEIDEEITVFLDELADKVRDLEKLAA